MDIVKFMVVYALQIMLFSCLGNILFTDIPAYRDLTYGARTLFDASLGNYSFTVLEKSAKGDMVGTVFLILFLLLNHILLLNLLIAILSSTYAYYETKGVSLYISGILQMRFSSRYNPHYGALVSSFTPWDVLVVPFLPFFMFKNAEDLKSLNSFLFHIAYLPIVFTLFVIFLMLNILILPLAYLKCLGIRIF